MHVAANDDSTGFSGDRQDVPASHPSARCAGQEVCGEPTRLEIGDRNTIREFCTWNLGTAQDVGVTHYRHDNWIMAYVHIAQ